MVRQRFFWIIAVVLLAVIVHLAYVLFVPGVEMNRLLKSASAAGGVNRFSVLPEDTAIGVFGQQAQAFVQGICVLDLKAGPVVMTVETPQSYWMVNVYSRSGDNIYSLNDRQVAEVPFTIHVEQKKPALFTFASEEAQPEDAAFKVSTGDSKGLFVVRVFVQDPAYRKRITRILERSTCRSSST